MMDSPQVLVIAGPNGAGKSTSASTLVPETIPFINADEIAKGLPDQGNKDIAASRQLLKQWEGYAAAKLDFAVETTLASRSLAGKIRRLKELGYQFSLIYLWLPSPEFAIARVAERVRQGGHNIPMGTIRRRYYAGMTNFLELYRPLADNWSLYQNLVPANPELVALGHTETVTNVILDDIWGQFNANYKI